MEIKQVIDSFKQAVASISEEMKKLPLEDYESEKGLDDSQAALLRALGHLLGHWPDQETAESVNITLGLLSTLRKLEPGQSLVLSSGGEDGFQVSMNRLQGEPGPDEFLSCYWCFNPNPPPVLRCCATISVPRDSGEPIGNPSDSK
jgi:hypothetical protein